MVTFSLANEDYAIELRYVRKVVRNAEMMPVPGTPDHLLGIINLRGEILAIFDLGRIMGLPATSVTDRSRIIVLGDDRDEFGLLAAEVHALRTVRVDEVRESSARSWEAAGRCCAA